MEVTAHLAASQVGVSNPTALRVITIIRWAIQAEQVLVLLRREVEADESHFGGRCKGKRGLSACEKVSDFKHVGTAQARIGHGGSGCQNEDSTGTNGQESEAWELGVYR